MEKVKEVINKVTHKDAAHTTGTHTTGTHTGTTGTHTGTTGTHTGTTGHSSGVTGSSGTAGPHNSNILNKADPRVDSDMDGSRNMGASQYGPGAHQTGNSGLTGQYDTAGPHSSNLANKADPRVDSDMDGSRNAGAASYGSGAHNTGTGLTGSSNTGYGTTGSNTAGPHSSNLANKADPRVDSDMDGSRNAGASQYGAGAHNTHNTGTGLTGSSNTGYGSTGSNTAGPHSSNMANKLDPRVDSDMDGSRNAGAASYGAGAHNTASSGLTGTGHSTNHGPYDSNLANKADPRVDSDRDGSRNMGAAQHGPGAHQQHGTFGGLSSGPGPAPHTAGPHKQDMLNKLDPRVDSDRDGSKTVGGQPQY